jgi:hypothetical protein
MSNFYEVTTSITSTTSATRCFFCGDVVMSRWFLPKRILSPQWHPQKSFNSTCFAFCSTCFSRQLHFQVTKDLDVTSACYNS